MLTELDEHFYHQTPSPVDAIRDSDPRFVDQHWFQCMDTEGRWIVGANWPIWPNSGIIENGQIIIHGDTQYNLRYSRTLERDGYRSNRIRQQVGPATMEVIEPLRKARFTLDSDNAWGISYDLTMDTFLKPVQTRTPIAFGGPASLPGVLPYFEIRPPPLPRLMRRRPLWSDVSKARTALEPRPKPRTSPISPQRPCLGSWMSVFRLCAVPP